MHDNFGILENLQNFTFLQAFTTTVCRNYLLNELPFHIFLQNTEYKLETHKNV